jgi:tetratricopeptide (TPR) repeat protein
MRRTGHCALVALLLLTCFSPGHAAAEPSIWQRAASPRAARVERALVRMERVLDRVNEASDDQDMMQDFRLGTLAVAELTGARELGDPRLLVLLSQALVDADLGRDGEALTLLERALAATPPDQVWLEAEIRPLLASALRDDPARAVREVSRALRLVWQPGLRSLLFRERAEAQMALGRVRASAADARAALAAASSNVQRALSRYALGLALERAGDLPSALSEVHLARLTAPALGGTEVGELDVPGIFVFRPADAKYLAALDSLATARTESDPGQAALAFERAAILFRHYAELVPEGDRWAAVARVHAAECERAHDGLARALKAQEPPADNSSSFF